MDLGLKGKKAIVCASSQGLGYACALALAQEGCEVFINGRNADKLAQAAQQLQQATGARITPVQADLNTEAGRSALLAVCPEPDILVNNNAGPPPGQLADWDHAAWMGALESNLLSAALLMRGTLPGMRARRLAGGKSRSDADFKAYLASMKPTKSRTSRASSSGNVRTSW